MKFTDKCGQVKWQNLAEQKIRLAIVTDVITELNLKR